MSIDRLFFLPSEILISGRSAAEFQNTNHKVERDVALLECRCYNFIIGNLYLFFLSYNEREAIGRADAFRLFYLQKRWKSLKIYKFC